jgi:hypothetical protein
MRLCEVRAAIPGQWGSHWMAGPCQASVPGAVDRWAGLIVW